MLRMGRRNVSHRYCSWKQKRRCGPCTETADCSATREASQNGGAEPTLSASVILTWVFNSTNGSVLMTTLLHGTQSAMARPGLLSDRPGGRPAVM
jgi:hypothetical protein